MEKINMPPKYESDFIGQLNDFIEQLDKNCKKLWADTGFYKGLLLDLPAYSWQRALSDYSSYTADLFFIFNDSGTEIKRLLSRIPIATARGTFVIEGSERVPNITLLPKNLKKGHKMSAEEEARDLSAFTVKQADVIDCFKRYFGWVITNLEEGKDIEKFLDVLEQRFHGDVDELFKNLSSIEVSKEYKKKVLKIKNKDQKNKKNFVEKQKRKSIKSFIEAHDLFTGGTNALIISIFNSKTGIEKFPFLDSTNPLSEVSHMRKVSFWGNSKSKKGRDMHPSHYGRLCVVETPESEKIGLRLHLANRAEIDTITGEILTPLIDLKTSMVKKVRPCDDSFVADNQENLQGKAIVRGGEDGRQVDASEIRYKDTSIDQLFGYAALQVPFISHNDPARALMGAKNLKQAVPLKNPESPVVVTTYEEKVAELSGRVVRSAANGKVSNVSKEEILIEADSGDVKTYYLINDIPSTASKSAVFQVPTVNIEDTVTNGQIIAEGAGIKNGVLALGANFLVAYMSYKGYNMDDGIVVSQRAAEKLTSIHIEEFKIEIKNGDIPVWIAMEGLRLSKSTPIAILKRKGKEIKHTANEHMVGGIVRKVILEEDTIRIWVKKERCLEVGDKIMGRHGNKGVVAKILSVHETPYFEIKKGEKKERRHIDLILNPHSVITRMNIGQIYETHFGWVAGEHPDEGVRNQARSSGKPFQKIDADELSGWLADSGLDSKGCIRVHFDENGEMSTTERSVAVGYQYIVKLNHLAANKLSARGEKGPSSFITEMPLSGRKRGGGQRIGEMEVWALLAHGADKIVKEILGERSNAHILETGAISVSESLKALIFYLRGLGIHLEFMDKKDNVIEAEDFEKSKRKILEKYRVRWADDSMMLSWGRHLSNAKKNQYEKLKDFLERRELEQEIRKGAREISNLNDFDPTYKDEMGYISLREPVKLSDRDISVLPVIPLRCRPKADSKINKLYKRIYLQNELIKKEGRDSNKYENIKKNIQNFAKELEEELSRHIRGKEGIIRKAILGKRVNFSARAVIVPNPDIQADEAEIPKKIMDELGIKDGDKVLLNRQPSLHIHNIQSFKATMSRNNAIGINPLVCSGFNADFDGDTMAIYKVNDKEIPTTMSATEQIVLAANGKLNLGLSQDIASGVYFATGTEHGREEFNKLIKEKNLEIPMTGRINKDILSNSVYRHFLKTNNREATLRLAEEVESFGLRWATLSGLSFSAFDLKELTLTETEKSGLVHKIDDNLNELFEDSLFNKLRSNADNPISIMIISGGRGDKKQLRQMIGRKGFIERLGGKKTAVPVESCYLEGLSSTEYYMACYGARNSLGDKKLLTPECGYLTRRLVFAAFDTAIREDDCKTLEGLASEISNAVGRTILNAIKISDTEEIPEDMVINEDLMGKLINAGFTEVEVRSPITCKSTNGICNKCYGWDLARRVEPAKNFKAGIVAAEVIGERATQDAMRTYHLGMATGTIKLFDKVKAIFDNAEDPETKKRVSEKIKSLEDLSNLAMELHEYYQKKVDLKHYEVILRALFIDNAYKGTKKAIEKRPVLYRASFERTLDILREAASNGETYSLQSVVENLFI